MHILIRWHFHSVLIAVLCASFSILANAAQPPGETALVMRAKELVDTYYGNGENLRRAAAFLAEAHTANPEDPNVYVQAARVTIKGAHLSFDAYEAGSFDRYAALLDKAIALDPSNADAHILKSEVYSRQGKAAEELAELSKAKALGTNSPWLTLAYGRHYMEVGQLVKALEAYTNVMDRGPGNTASDRKAFIVAVEKLSDLTVGDEPIKEKMRKYAAIALKERYPTDAWTPQGFAERFIDLQMFEEAIIYAREALVTMDFGAGRMTLAAALYARAAQLELAKQSRDKVQPLVREAQRLGIPKARLLEYLLHQRGHDSLQFLAPTLNKLMP